MRINDVDYISLTDLIKLLKNNKSIKDLKLLQKEVNENLINIKK